jgi:uncharacterized membrane protein
MEHPAMDHPLERLVFFSDAVFAIAITLLVIEIDVPNFPRRMEIADQWHELFALWPSFFAFALSFLVIGRFWMGHHALFAQVTRYDDALMWPNLLFLMAIATMPFATAFLGRNVGHFVPELVYNLAMLLCGVLSLSLGWMVYRAGLFGAGLDGRGIALRPLAVILAAALCVGMTFVLPLLSQWGMITVPLWGRLLRNRVTA